MRTYIERVQDQAPASKTRNKFDRSLKPRNPNLYYNHSHMEYYYIYQQCKNYFEIAASQDHKRIPFIARFMKDCIFNH